MCVCPPTALNLSLQHEIRLRYLFMHRAQNHSFYKLTDMGGNGKFATKKKSGYGWIWIWPNGAERNGSQNFAP